jgi:hypothetical protein
MYLIRFFEFDTFFTNSGLVEVKSLKSLMPEILSPPMRLFLENEIWSRGLYVLFLILLLLMVFGLLNRMGNVLVFLLHLGFLQRNPAIIYGADLVTTCWLFYLCFMRSQEHFTLRPWLKFLKAKEIGSDLLSGVGFRLVQIHLCVIYGYTGLEKLKGETWWEGTAVWYVVSNDNIVPFNMEFFQHAPSLIALMTFSTLIFEVYFPLAIWLKPLRNFWLFLGLCLHSLSAIFMGLIFFAPIMMAAYLFFIDPSIMKSQIKRMFERIPILRIFIFGPSRL